MATTSLIENFQNLAVKDESDELQQHGTCLPFNPGPDSGISPRRLERVDRYLFRLFDKNSDGYTDCKWVKSKDADKTRFQYDKDIFEREDRHEVAQALNEHLYWSGEAYEEDNFVSWSSSLLVVLQYAHFRARRCDFREMFLCVVDTTLLPPKVFMRDMDLLAAFSRYDNSPSYMQKTLPKLQSLRRKKHREYSGSYYFGEYLSQGALHIENCCSIVPIAHIIDTGLYVLKEELADPTTIKEKWANRVIKLREVFYDSSIRYLAHDREIEYALRIGDLFGSTLKLPMALALLALKPRRIPDEAMVKEFRPLYGKEGQGGSQLSPEATMVVLNSDLPELRQFDELRRYLYKDSVLSTILRKCETANDELRHALLLARQVPQLDPRTPSRIKTQPHYGALDALAQTGQELEEALAVILQPAEYT